MIQTFNLLRGEDGPSYDESLGSRAAVICAHAQSIGDYNTWNYERDYGSLVRESEDIHTCGIFTARRSKV